MTLKECYEILGGDYDDVLGRFRREALVEKFVFKFFDDPSFDNLCEAIKENNGEDAFRAAHTIKGVCQNLSFNALFESSQKLTEELRGNVITDESINLLGKVKEDYSKTIEAINSFKNRQ